MRSFILPAMDVLLRTLYGLCWKDTAVSPLIHFDIFFGFYKKTSLIVSTKINDANLFEIRLLFCLLRFWQRRLNKDPFQYYLYCHWRVS